MGQGVGAGLRRLAAHVGHGRVEVDAARTALQPELGQQLVGLLQRVDADAARLLLGGLRQLEVAARVVVEAVGLVADVVHVHGEFGEAVEESGRRPHVLPLAHRLRLLGRARDRGALRGDQGREFALGALAVRVVGLGGRQRRRVRVQGAGGLVVPLGDVLHELSRLGQARGVGVAAVAVPLGTLGAPGRILDLDEQIAQALELGGIAFHQGRIALFQELDVLAVAEPAHLASGFTYCPDARRLPRKDRAVSSSTPAKSVPVVFRRVARAANRPMVSLNWSSANWAKRRT